MLEIFRSATLGQFCAAYDTLKSCIELCPDELWDGPVVNMQFNQAAFHALFFSDLYLGESLATFREQEFHRDHASLFRDYEELEEKPPCETYSKSDMELYLAFCRDKSIRVIGSETEQTLARTPGFDWFDFARAEVHVTNIRHLFHHAAQLSLRIRAETGDGVPWIRTSS